MLKRFLRNYAERHRHPVNVAFHVIGLPVTFILPPILLASGQAFYSLIAFILGYALQFLGHAIEGNDAGEICLLKRWLGLPYVAIVSRESKQTESPPLTTNPTAGDRSSD